MRVRDSLCRAASTLCVPADPHPHGLSALSSLQDKERWAHIIDPATGKPITGPCACWMAANVYAGFMGPFQEVPVTPGFPTPQTTNNVEQS